MLFTPFPPVPSVLLLPSTPSLPSPGWTPPPLFADVPPALFVLMPFGVLTQPIIELCIQMLKTWLRVVKWRTSHLLSQPFISCSARMDHRISWDLMGSVPKGEIPDFTFPLFFDLILCSFILISFRLYDALAFYYVFLIPLPTTSVTPSSIPPSHVHLPSFITLSLHHPLIPSFCIPISQLLASPFCSIVSFPTSVYYSLPLCSNFVYLTFCPLWLCESFPTFSMLLQVM